MKKNEYLLVETIGIFLLVSAFSVMCKMRNLAWYAHFPILFFQGLWFYRFYIVGHEASHKKLVVESLAKNDIWGSIILLPIMTPLNIFRKIHFFHHGFNRKDAHTSALDVYETRFKPNIFIKIYYYTLWYISVFFGGLFLHSFISVILFLFIPPSVSVKISPAFKGWTWNDQIKAILLFLLGVVFHVVVYILGGKNIYLYTLGYPMLFFAWILSLLVYVFHYDTTMGNETRYNVRSVDKIPFFSWLLLNFNEHATHHQHPNIPWYELPEKRTPLPEKFHQQNQNTSNYFKAILNQLKGPTIIYLSENEHNTKS